MRTFLKSLFAFLLLFFLLINLMIYNHAYKSLHFTGKKGYEKKQPEDLTTADKFKLAFTGLTVSKPENTIFPKKAYKTITIPSRFDLEAWVVEVPESRGMVLLFHGYRVSKSQMVGYGDVLNKEGFSTMLVDFPGSGGSGGLETSIGYNEALDVKRSLEVADSLYADMPKYLLGSSMGAVAIMRSVAVYQLAPEKIVLECPFGTMQETLEKRLDAMNAPRFPFSRILMFWGGWQMGFDAYLHNPSDYAASIQLPTLLMSGKKDNRVSVAETEIIFDRLNGPKELTWMDNCGHQGYLGCEADRWRQAVLGFLQ